MRRPLALAALGLLPACYLSHDLEEPVDPRACAPEGPYTVEMRVTPISPGCGGGGTTFTQEVEIPPTADGLGRGDDVEIVMSGPCRWEVSAETVVPDFSVTLDGTIDTSDGTVRGDFESTSVGITGVPCTSRIAWRQIEGPAAPPSTAAPPTAAGTDAP